MKLEGLMYIFPWEIGLNEILKREIGTNELLPVQDLSPALERIIM
jgi:hypothetical protein